MDMEKINTRWSYFDTLTVWQAAALIEGCDPDSVEYTSGAIKNTTGKLTSDEFTHVKTIFLALIQSIKAGKLEATIIRDGRLGREFEYHSDAEGQWDATQMYGAKLLYKKAPNWEKTTISIDSLKRWLLTRTVQPECFFSKDPSKNSAVRTKDCKPDYLNTDHPRYSSKLAATIAAWQAVTDPKNKSPKQALEAWLTVNASEFGLMHDHGVPVKQAIEECSKIANWKPDGGATKTPG